MGIIHVVTLISIIVGILLALIWRSEGDNKREANINTLGGFIAGVALIWILAGIIYGIFWAANL